MMMDDQIFCGQPLAVRNIRVEIPDPCSSITSNDDRAITAPRSPPTSPLSSKNQRQDAYRPPTPPKVRDMTANSPRRKSPPNRPVPIKAVPIRGKNKHLSLLKIEETEDSDDGTDSDNSEEQHQNGEENGHAAAADDDDDDDDDDDQSQSSLLQSELQNSFQPLNHSPVVQKLVEAAVKGKKTVRFADEVDLNEVFEISKLHVSALHDMFYASEDLAEFRYEAFMEEAGLDPSQFD